MNLSPEIEQAARALGQNLHNQEVTRAYLGARQRVETDPEASALEKEMYAWYEVLTARQQAGEQLSRDEVEAFHALRNRFFNHHLVSERETALRPLKSLFAEVAVEISFPLGADYTILTQSG